MRTENAEKFMCLKDFAFICAASYERRAFAVPQYVVSVASPCQTCIFHATDCCNEVDAVAEELCRMLPSAQLVESRLSDPLFTAKNIERAVAAIVSSGCRDILVDITTFTHEQLLMLLRVLHDESCNIGRVSYAYSHSAEYSYEEGAEDKWLSKGCKQIRSVVGYPGLLIPGRPMALILLAGFEHERATSVIMEMEPDKLLIGTGVATGGEKSVHQQSMRRFQSLIREFCAMRPSVGEFEFSSQNVKAARASIEAAVTRFADVNCVVVPMNTKLSTLALAGVAFNNPNIQICYAQPEMYNVNSYSMPGDLISFLDSF